MGSGTWALVTDVIYFGTFLAMGYVTKRAIDRWMSRHGETLTEIQEQAGADGRKGGSFLLGIWRR